MIETLKRDSDLLVSRKRAGFTLMEIVVASLVMVILAAVTIPQVMDALDKKRVEDTYNILVGLNYGFANSNGTGFMNIVRTGASATNTSAVPGKLNELSEIIVSQNLNYPNSCGTGTTGGTGYFNTTAATTWTLGGPFIQQVVSATDGLSLPIGQLQNTLVRSAALGTQPAWIELVINNVDTTDAKALDLRVDGVQGTNAGTVRYTLTASSTTVDYLIPIPNRC
jgi:prepilin-type N-terminal cleavage/methylation domain-containing protein